VQKQIQRDGLKLLVVGILIMLAGQAGPVLGDWWLVASGAERARLAGTLLAMAGLSYALWVFVGRKIWNLEGR
jgi:hypothetical protein